THHHTNTSTSGSQSGTPLGAPGAPDTPSLIGAQPVVPGAPWPLLTRRPCDQRPAASAEQASPATINVCNGTSSESSFSNTGGNVACVTVCSRSSCPRPSPRRSCAGRTSVAPDPNAVTISDTAASKLREANWSTRAGDVIAKRSICAAASDDTPACVTATPFGVPVEPEV